MATSNSMPSSAPPPLPVYSPPPPPPPATASISAAPYAPVSMRAPTYAPVSMRAPVSARALPKLIIPTKLCITINTNISNRPIKYVPENTLKNAKGAIGPLFNPLVKLQKDIIAKVPANVQQTQFLYMSQFNALMDLHELAAQTYMSKSAIIDPLEEYLHWSVAKLKAFGIPLVTAQLESLPQPVTKSVVVNSVKKMSELNDATYKGVIDNNILIMLETLFPLGGKFYSNNSAYSILNMQWTKGDWAISVGTSPTPPITQNIQSPFSKWNITTFNPPYYKYIRDGDKTTEREEFKRVVNAFPPEIRYGANYKRPVIPSAPSPVTPSAPPRSAPPLPPNPYTKNVADVKETLKNIQTAPPPAWYSNRKRNSKKYRPTVTKQYGPPKFVINKEGNYVINPMHEQKPIDSNMRITTQVPTLPTPANYALNKFDNNNDDDGDGGDIPMLNNLPPPAYSPPLPPQPLPTYSPPPPPQPQPPNGLPPEESPEGFYDAPEESPEGFYTPEGSPEEFYTPEGSPEEFYTPEGSPEHTGGKRPDGNILEDYYRKRKQLENILKLRKQTKKVKKEYPDLCYHITIDLELYRGENLTPEQLENAKCNNKWEAIRKAYAEMSGQRYIMYPYGSAPKAKAVVAPKAKPVVAPVPPVKAIPVTTTPQAAVPIKKPQTRRSGGAMRHRHRHTRKLSIVDMIRKYG